MANKQGEVKTITQKDISEFKGEDKVVKKTSIITIITMQGGKPMRIFFEDGKQVKAEEATEK